MTELIQKAIAKIDAEAEKMGGTYAQLLASHVIDNYLNSDENAEKVMDKQLSAAFAEIKSKAQKQASNGCAMIDDATVYDWLREFYGFTSKENNNNVVSLFDLM